MLQGGNTALHWAAYNGHSDAVQILLDANATVDVINDVSWSNNVCNDHTMTRNTYKMSMGFHRPATCTQHLCMSQVL